MIGFRSVLPLVMLGIVVPAAAAPNARLQVTGGSFFAEMLDAEGNILRVETDRIPNDPGTSCYGWEVRFRPQTGVRTLTERMTLPAAAAQWGGADGVPESSTSVSRDRAAADTGIVVALPTGVATHGWCVAEGDPVGPYRIEVLDGARTVRRFDFTVVQQRNIRN